MIIKDIYQALAIKIKASYNDSVIEYPGTDFNIKENVPNDYIKLTIPSIAKLAVRNAQRLIGVRRCLVLVHLYSKIDNNSYRINEMADAVLDALENINVQFSGGYIQIKEAEYLQHFDDSDDNTKKDGYNTASIRFICFITFC